MIQNKETLEELVSDDLFKDIDYLNEQFMNLNNIDSLDQSITISNKLVDILKLVQTIQDKVI